MDVLISILIVSSIAAGLAGLLILAERFIGNYGECTITINKDKQLQVQGGSSLLECLTQNKIFIPSACGGRGTCGFCKVKVHAGAGPLLPTEEPYLSKEDRAQDVRLSCQVKVKNDLEVEIPDHLFNVREFVGTCTHMRSLTHDIKEFRITLKDPPDIRYTPGQYVQLFCPAYGENDDVYRAYSIASDSQDVNILELVIRKVPGGICTTWCFDHLKEGDDVKLNGPYGDFYLTDSDAPCVFIAGGSGMAPMRSMLLHMKSIGSKRKATFFFGANTTEDLFYLDEMKQFEESLADFSFVPVVAGGGPDWKGEAGLVTDAVKRNITDAPESEAYLCGSPGMIDASVDVLVGLGMNKENIFYDKF